MNHHLYTYVYIDMFLAINFGFSSLYFKLLKVFRSNFKHFEVISNILKIIIKIVYLAVPKFADFQTNFVYLNLASIWKILFYNSNIGQGRTLNGNVFLGNPFENNVQPILFSLFENHYVESKQYDNYV